MVSLCRQMVTVLACKFNKSCHICKIGVKKIFSKMLGLCLFINSIPYLKRYKFFAQGSDWSLDHHVWALKFLFIKFIFRKCKFCIIGKMSKEKEFPCLNIYGMVTSLDPD